MANQMTELVVMKADYSTVMLPYPQEVTSAIYDIDASTTGRNAAGLMIRDRVAVKRKFSCKWAALSQSDLTKILTACEDARFWIWFIDPKTGLRTKYWVYVGDRTVSVYWYPSYDQDTWMYASLSMNFIEL